MKKKPSEQKVQSTQEIVLAPEQRELLSYAMPLLKGFAENPPSAYSGPRVAGFNPTQRSAQQGYLEATGGLKQQARKAGEFQNFLMGPAMDPKTNPYLRSTIDAATKPIRRSFREDILPGLRTGATQTGQFGSTRHQIAQGIAGRGVAEAVGDTASNIAFGGYQSGLQAGSRALALAPQTAQLGLIAPQIRESVGAQRQAQEQAEIDAGREEYADRALWPLLIAQQIAGTAAGLPGSQGVGTTTSPGLSQPSFAQRALGGAATGAAIGSIIPGVGTGIGAGLGALTFLLGS